MKKVELQKRIDQEEYLLGDIRPSAKNYQAQFQKVKDLKTELEFLEVQEQNRLKNNPNTQRD